MGFLPSWPDLPHGAVRALRRVPRVGGAAAGVGHVRGYGQLLHLSHPVPLPPSAGGVRCRNPQGNPSWCEPRGAVLEGYQADSEEEAGYGFRAVWSLELHAVEGQEISPVRVYHPRA